MRNKSILLEKENKMSYMRLFQELATLKTKLETNHNELIEDGEYGPRWKDVGNEELYQYIIANTRPEVHHLINLREFFLNNAKGIFVGINEEYNESIWTDLVHNIANTQTDTYQKAVKQTYTVAKKLTENLTATKASIYWAYAQKLAYDYSEQPFSNYIFTPINGIYRVMTRIAGRTTTEYNITDHGWWRFFNMFDQMTQPANDKWFWLNKTTRNEATYNNAKEWVARRIREINAIIKNYETKETVKNSGFAKLFEQRVWNETMNETLTNVQKLIINQMKQATPARTWGFELEVPDAKDIPAPIGVEKGDDGSLRSYQAGDNCECDCDSCYYHECDCEHCETGSSDPDHDCGSSACTQADSAEYRTTGGVTRTIHKGLITLCEKLKEAEAEINDTAGIHIHVWAKDLTTKQVAQVLAIYKYLEPMWEPIAGRRNTHYAGDLNIDKIKTAFSKMPRFDLTKQRAVNVGPINSPRGTIEFRQMTSHLDAQLTLAWAWMVRGLVTAAQRGLEIGEARKITTLQQYVETLAKYGVTPTHEGYDDYIIYGSRSDADHVTELGKNKLQLTAA